MFIDELGECANVSASAAEAGVSRKTVYQERKADAGFAHAWDEAIETALDRAEGELYRRAVEGVEEPVFYKGDIVGAIRRYSDTALIFMLKTRRRSIYGDRSTNLNLDMSRLTTQQLERIANGEDPAIVLATPGDGRAGAETAGTTGTE